jgi:hypothetical protein
VANYRRFTLRGPVHRFPSGSFANGSTSRRLIHYTPLLVRVTDRSTLGLTSTYGTRGSRRDAFGVRPTFIVDNVACPDGYALPAPNLSPALGGLGKGRGEAGARCSSGRPRPPDRK